MSHSLCPGLRSDTRCINCIETDRLCRAGIFADAIDYNLVGSACVNVAPEVTYRIETVAGGGLSLASATLQDGGTVSLSAMGESRNVVLTPGSLVFFDLENGADAGFTGVLRPGKTVLSTATEKNSLGADIPGAIISWVHADPAIVRKG